MIARPALRTLVVGCGHMGASHARAYHRLRSDFEIVGAVQGDTVTIRPIHTPSLFVYKDGKRLRVTYWCDVCAIRTYTPGICWCCREETELDLRDPDKVD